MNYFSHIDLKVEKIQALWQRTMSLLDKDSLKLYLILWFVIDLLSMIWKKNFQDQIIKALDIEFALYQIAASALLFILALLIYGLNAFQNGGVALKANEKWLIRTHEEAYRFPLFVGSIWVVGGLWDIPSILYYLFTDSMTRHLFPSNLLPSFWAILLGFAIYIESVLLRYFLAKKEIIPSTE